MDAGQASHLPGGPGACAQQGWGLSGGTRSSMSSASRAAPQTLGPMVQPGGTALHRLRPSALWPGAGHLLPGSFWNTLAVTSSELGLVPHLETPTLASLSSNRFLHEPFLLGWPLRPGLMAPCPVPCMAHGASPVERVPRVALLSPALCSVAARAQSGARTGAPGQRAREGFAARDPVLHTSSGQLLPRCPWPCHTVSLGSRRSGGQ